MIRKGEEGAKRLQGGLPLTTQVPSPFQLCPQLLVNFRHDYHTYEPRYITKKHHKHLNTHSLAFIRMKINNKKQPNLLASHTPPQISLTQSNPFDLNLTAPKMEHTSDCNEMGVVVTAPARLVQ